MIGVLGGLKLVTAFISQWRVYIYIAAIGAIALTVFNYIDNHGEMKAAIKGKENIIAHYQQDILDFEYEIDLRDAQIAAINAQRRKEVEAAREQLQRAKVAIQEVREENTKLKFELEVTRFETVEAMQYDEDFNDWANESVPITGWRLLQQAANPETN